MSTLLNTLPDEKIPFFSVNKNNMFIKDAKVKELVYSGNTAIFLIPSRECFKETFVSGHLHNH